MDEKQLQALFNEMKSKLELGDFATFKNQIGSDEKFRKAFYNEASADLDLGDFNAFNESFKKKVSTTPSTQPVAVSTPKPAVTSPSALPSPSGLTYNDIELVIEDARKKARRLQDLKEAPTSSAGIGAPGTIIPKATLDRANQEMQLAENKKKEVIAQYQRELSRPVEKLIETGEYKGFFTQDGVFDEAKARDYFKKVTQKFGGGSHLQDQWLVNLKTRGQQEIDKPRFNQILGEEMSKQKLDLNQYSTKIFNQLSKEQRATAESLSNERDAEALKILQAAEAKAKEFKTQLDLDVVRLNIGIKSGAITPEQAAATYDELVKEYETTIKGIDNGYKDAMRKMNIRVNGKFNRIEQELRDINASIDDSKVMQSLPADIRKKLELAYQTAGQRLSTEKNEAKKKQEEVTGIGTTDVISRNINLALKSVTSGFNRGLAEVGEYLNMKGMSGGFVDALRNRRTAAETFAPAQYEWNKDEWLKRAISSAGTSLGASAPILLPTIGAVALTGGGAAGALAAGALSFAGESAQIGGGQFREGLEETGDVSAATKRAEEVMRQNAITAPLYFIGGLGDVMITTGKGLSKVATGIALEQLEEIPTEYIQSFNEAKAKGYQKGISDFIKENPGIAADTFISTVGQSGAMKGIVSALSVFQKNIPESTVQMLTDAVSKNGVEFTNSLIDKWFEAGKINQGTVVKLKAEVSKIEGQLPKMQEAGVDGDKAKLMASLSSQVQELQTKINTEKDPAVKALYQNQLNVVNQDISQLVKGEAPYVVFTLPGGGDMTRVMTVREFQALPAETSNDMVKSSDGITVVGDDNLNTQLTQKKQELGTPQDAAPGVFTAPQVTVAQKEVFVTGTAQGLENLKGKAPKGFKDRRMTYEQSGGKQIYFTEDIVGDKKIFSIVDRSATDDYGREGFVSTSMSVPKESTVTLEDVKGELEKLHQQTQTVVDKDTGKIDKAKLESLDLGVGEVAPPETKPQIYEFEGKRYEVTNSYVTEVETGNLLPVSQINKIRSEGKLVGEVAPEAAPQVPAAPAKAPITTIEVEEAARQMQPITDRMVQIEREFENLGYKIDTDYDNEMIVSDIEGNEVGEIPESLVPLAAEYEKATRRLGEFDDRARERALSKSREVVEAEAVEVKPELPAAPAKSRVQDAIDKYDEGDISTINDLVDEIEAIADEEGNQVVLDAVEEYREEQRYNESLKGRGDMDAAEDAFLSKIRGVGEVAPEAAPEVPAAPEKTQDEVAKEQTKETDLLLGGQAEQRRKDGKYTKDGVEYVRNPKGQGIASEVTGEVRFTNEVSLPFKYKLVEAETLQPSHQDGIRNPLHFIPEAQPKNRNDVGSLQAEESFANNPRFSELGENTNAYSGAPVVNERGEVVQGNNRSAGLRKGYQRNNPQYKNDLAANAEQFGFTREQVEGMKNPVLVREVAVSDQGAVELGNYDAKDLETGGKRRVDPIAVTRRMPFDVKGRIADLFTGEETLNQAIRANQKRLLELLNPYLNQAQRNTITKDGILTDAGIKDLEAVVQQFLFDNGDTALPDLFERLSATQKEGLRKSLPYIYSAGVEKSVIPEIQEAILAVNEFVESGAGTFDAWLAQRDMFNEGKTPKDKYTALELEIARTLAEAKTQKEITKKFIDYADVVKDKEADMFEAARPGKSKEEGVQETFKVKYNAKPISERGGKEVAPKEKPAAEPSAEKRAGTKERKPKAELPPTDKRAEARKSLKDAFDDLMNLGIVYDPKSQAEKQVKLTRAIIRVIKEESIGAIKSLKKYLKDNIGLDISDNDAKYLLLESKKPEYAVQEPKTGEVPVQPKARAGEKVEAGVPPTRPPKAPEEGKVESEEKRVSGIKKALVSKEVLESVDLDKTGDKQLLEAGRKIIDSGEVEPKLLIDKIIDEGRGVLSPAEVVAMITYKADLDTKIEDLTAEIEQLEASGQDIGTKGVELKNLQVEQRNFEIAAVITAQQQSMSFRLRRWMLDRTYSLQQQIAQYKKANGGTIAPEVLAQFEKMDAEIQELKKQIKEAEARKVDEEGQAAVENIAEDVKREDARTLTDEEIDERVQKGVEAEISRIYEQLPAKRRSRADQAIAALERIQKRLRSRTYDASIGIPVAIIDMGITTIKNAIKAGVAIEKAIELGIGKIKEGLKGKPFTNEDKFRKDLLEGFEVEGIKTEKEVVETPSISDDGSLSIPEKFLRDLVRKGINTIDGLTDAAFKELESQLPGLTKRQVRDAITQYGRTVNPSQDEVRQQLATARRLGRLISELEDLKSMSKAEFALKYFKQPSPSKITEAEKNLKKQINSLARDLKTDAQVLSQAKESAKRRIEELQRRLREKDYASRPKPIVKADAELEILLGKKQALQDKFEEAKKKAELKNRTIGQRIEDIALEIFSGISRALVAGFDLSAAFVQGTRRVFTNPVMSAKAFAEGLRQFASPSRMERFMQRYKGTYNYSVARNSGLAISDVDGTLSAKEQIFVTNWANTIYDLIANVVTLGHKPSAEFIKRINPLKASQRAFDGYMNYIRISSFELEMAALKNMGYTPDSNPEVYKAAADFVNTATGRANMGPLEASSKWLSTIMFAPRKVASELKLYSPIAFLYYANMPAPVRKRALIDFAKFSASVLVTHALVKAAIDTYGGDEEDYEDFWNSDSPNFLAFKIGDKRISFLGGIKSTIVFISRLIGQDYVDQYGIKTKFGERYGKKIDSKLELTTQFLLGKASPGAGAVRDYLDKNPNYENDDEILQNLVVPMWLQDAKELYKEDPLAVTAMFNMLAIIGANIRKVDMKQVQDQIIFKEKIKGKEVKRVVKLTDAQKEEFQNLVKERAKIELSKIAPIVKKEKSGSKRAEYDKMAIDKAKKFAQAALEKKYKKLFQQFPVQEKEEDDLIQKVKKKLK